MFASRRLPLLLLLVLVVAIAARGIVTSGSSKITWTGSRHVSGVVDLAGPDAQGSLFVEAAGRLEVLTTGGELRPFAPAYRPSPGLESYLVLSSGQRVVAADCGWPAGDLYALRLANPAGVSVISPQGRVSNLVDLQPDGLENGIAFDRTGRFGHRLLVTTTSTTRRATGVTTVEAISCNGLVQVVTRTAPRVEGGLVVAPPDFGRFGGDLLAPDEDSGNLYAIAPSGQASLVVRSGLAHGADIGIESLGLVPGSYSVALVADRGTPRNRHPGDNVILRVGRAALTGAGVKAGELLAVSEGGAATVAVSCASSCRARYIGHGPAPAHVEGHVVFAGGA